MSYTASPHRYNNLMPYARCGRSGLKLPRISLGLWHNFGDVDCYATGLQVALRAFDLGITHFDLANNYGPSPGSAERTFGRILRENLADYRDELIISTKAGFDMWAGPYGEWGSRKNLLSSLDQSLKRMGIEYVDIFYVHRPDPETPLEETMGALDHAVRSGKALYVGISNYPAEMTQRALEILKGLGTPCLIHQARYNMFDRWIEGGLTEVLEKEGVGSIVYSPLGQGLLSDRYLNGIPADSRARKNRFLNQYQVEERLPKIRLLHAISEQRGQSLAEMALAWVLRLPTVTSALVGASSVAQLENNLKALHGLSFAPEELAAIETILKE